MTPINAPSGGSPEPYGVHNAGEPIAIADQLSIFDTFSRRGVAKVRAGGWGLGLDLVKGRAADEPGEPQGAMP